jgi:16S rRNA (adenine1518-N6/adenine1519-N6)-dimethyltransferase
VAHPKSTLDSLGAAARKSLSQNFLSSPHWIEKLTDSILEGEETLDAVWEVGPGLGALTHRLVDKSPFPIVVFEFDRKFAASLREKLPRIEVVEGDFLKADLTPRLVNKRVGFISNLPYHLSSPILFKLTEFQGSFVRLVLTFQREFAERLVGKPRTPAYSGLSVMMQLCFRMESLGIIPPGAFYPKPKVDSQAIRLCPLPLPEGIQIEALRKIVRCAFQHRRKKVASNLSLLYPKAHVETVLTEMKIDRMARPEEISPEGYLKLGVRLHLLTNGAGATKGGP